MERYWEIKDVLLSSPGFVYDLVRIVYLYEGCEFMRLEKMALQNTLEDLHRFPDATAGLLQAVTFMHGQREYQDISMRDLLRGFIQWERPSEGCQRFWCRTGEKQCCCGDPVLPDSIHED